MSVTAVTKDAESLTMTVTAEFEATVERVWKLWENPRELEQWWGPPTYPATFVEHDLTPGARASYYMTGPDGDQPRGWWEIVSVDAPTRLEFVDGFADAAGMPNPEMPSMTIRVTLEPHGEAGTRMVIQTVFPSAEAMEQLVAMGMAEGMTEAVNQIDELLRSGVTPR